MSIVTVFIETSESIGREQRVDKQWRLFEFKGRLEPITGIPVSSQKLELFKGKQSLGVLEDDNRPLGFYIAEDNMVLHVSDTNPHRIKGEFTDTSRVEKFELSDQEYMARTDTVRAFKERNKLGQFSEEAIQQKKEFDHANAEAAARIKLGDRCEVQQAGSTGAKPRGVVRYIGPVTSLKGLWVGIQYDEPLGKNDGTFKGERYFECADKYGAFVIPTAVTAGDYPERSILDELDELEEM